MKLSSLGDLFLHELNDVYDAEQQIVEALPKMAKAASNPWLRTAFEEHLEQTRGHVAKLESVFEEYGQEPERQTCQGMKGLLAEGNRLMQEDAEPEVLDAALISAAQRVEHYEISAYGTLRTWAETIASADVTATLASILEEEEQADQKLSEIAESTVNQDAAQDVEE